MNNNIEFSMQQKMEKIRGFYEINKAKPDTEIKININDDFVAVSYISLIYGGPKTDILPKEVVNSIVAIMSSRDEHEEEYVQNKNL